MDVGSIAAALRSQQFERALELLQPALQAAPTNPQLWTLQVWPFQEKEIRRTRWFRSTVR